jgi:hypothetical protein
MLLNSIREPSSKCNVHQFCPTDQPTNQPTSKIKLSNYIFPQCLSLFGSSPTCQSAQTRRMFFEQHLMRFYISNILFSQKHEQNRTKKFAFVCLFVGCSRANITQFFDMEHFSKRENEKIIKKNLLPII